MPSSLLFLNNDANAIDAATMATNVTVPHMNVVVVMMLSDSVICGDILGMQIGFVFLHVVNFSTPLANEKYRK
jgi:hypothetical protein